MILMTTNIILLTGFLYTTYETSMLIYTNNITRVTYGKDVVVFTTHTACCQFLFLIIIYLIHFIRRLELRNKWIRDNYQSFDNA